MYVTYEYGRLRNPVSLVSDNHSFWQRHFRMRQCWSAAIWNTGSYSCSLISTLSCLHLFRRGLAECWSLSPCNRWESLVKAVIFKQNEIGVSLCFPYLSCMRAKKIAVRNSSAWGYAAPPRWNVFAHDINANMHSVILKCNLADLQILALSETTSSNTISQRVRLDDHVILVLCFQRNIDKTVSVG